MSSAPPGQNLTAERSIAADLARWNKVSSFPSMLGAGLVALLVILLYYRVLGKLVIDWWRIPDDSHGFLVPIFAGYLLWSLRVAIRETRLRPTWSGVAVIVLGLSTLLLGTYGANLFLSRISFVILLTGFTLCFGGWALLRQIRYPLLVLLIAIPLPALVLNLVTFPLQIFASKVASDLLPLFGVPVLREGNVIQLPVMKLEVAEACSGIRSLVSLFAMATFFGYFAEKSIHRRFVLILLSVPIAIAANSLRIVGTGLCVQYWDSEKASGFFHEFSGLVMFLISLLCLFFIQRTMSVVRKAGRRS